VLNGDLGHFRVAHHYTAVGNEAVPHRLRELACTTLRNRKPESLAQHDQQQTEKARPRPVQRDVCVQGVSGEEQPNRIAAELLLEGDRRGSQQLAYEGQPANAWQRDHGPQSGRQWRERRDEGVDQTRSDPPPLINEGAPGLTIARMFRIQQTCGDVHVAVQHRPRAIPSGMPEHGRGMPPTQPVVLQVQALDHPGGRRHRIERAEGVGDEIRMQFPITAYRATDFRLSLEQQGVPAGIRQPVSRHQPIGTSTDVDRICLTRQRHVHTLLLAPLYSHLSTHSRRNPVPGVIFD
jgi:hypothetical protein